jgi:N-hydroxyarylamine O-acetyltransferase
MSAVSYLPRYLARLGLSEPPPPTLASLAHLQRQHVLTFPFENLCLHVPTLRAPITLDEPALAAKIVAGSPGRGGYCFELNTLFARLLARLGFRVTTGAARVVEREQPADGDLLRLQPLTHMVLFVDLDEGRYLVDVGFGPRGPLAPLPLRHLATVTDADPVRHRVRRGDAGSRSIVLPGEGWYLQVCLPSGSWEELYFFTEARYFSADYEALNYYTSTSPDCFATRYAIWCRPLAEGGRLELRGRHFRRYAADESITDEVEIGELDDMRAILEQRCGVELR